MQGYVYLIGTPIFRWYKIGKSKTPEIRVKDLGILLPFKVHVIAVWKAEDHTRMESALHEMYAAQRINGEWFEFDRKEVNAVCDGIPAEVRVYPADGAHPLDKFSNIHEDTRQGKKVTHVRVQKLRGDFTDEERERRKLASIKMQKERKALGLPSGRHGYERSINSTSSPPQVGV